MNNITNISSNKNKIKLTGFILHNWYGFGYEEFMLDGTINDTIYVTGANESGKSTIADAFSYAIFGDTVFNKSAETHSAKKRDLSSYVRKFDPALGKCERTGKVLSHLLFGYIDESTNKEFVLGTVIQATASGTDTARFIANCPLKKLKIYKEESGGKVFFRADEIKRANEHIVVKVYTNGTEGVKNFHQKLNLDPEKYLETRIAVRNFKTYDPHISPDKFVKDYILPDKNVEEYIENLKGQKRNADATANDLKSAEKEKDLLQKVIRDYDEFRKALERKGENQYRRAIREYEEAKSKLDELNSEYRRKSEECTQKQTVCKIKKSLKSKLEDQIRELESKSTAKEWQKKINELSKQISYQQTIIDGLKKDADKIAELMNNILDINAEFHFDQPIIDLTDPAISTETKCAFLDAFKDFCNEQEEIIDSCDFVSRISKLKKDYESKKSELNERKSKLNAYTGPEEYKRLREAINQELINCGRVPSANYAYSFIDRIKEEDWRNAIETTLGNNRYTVIVNESDWDIAERVQRKGNFGLAKLANIPQLMKTNIRPPLDDSLFGKLVIAGTIPTKYFQYVLGHVVGADEEDVFRYGNAISKNLRTSKAMAVYYSKCVESLCIGQKANELMIASLEKEIPRLESELATLNRDFETAKNGRKKISKVSCSGEYDFSVLTAIEKSIASKEADEKQKSEYERILAENKTEKEINDRINELRQEFRQIEDEVGSMEHDIGGLESDIAHIQKDIDAQKDDIKQKELNLNEMKDANPTLYEKAEESIRIYFELKKQNKPCHNYKDVPDDTINYDIRIIEKKFETSINQYHDSFKRFSNIINSESDFKPFRDRYKTLNESEIKMLQQKYAQMNENIGNSFWSDIVSSIHVSVKEAQHYIKELNRKLANNSFNRSLKIEVHEKKGGEFSDVLTYARQKEAHSKGLAEIDPVLEGKMKIFLAKILNEDMSSNWIKAISDYKNYVDCKILQVDDKTGEFEDLAKTIGYKSGAGTQMPYIIIQAVSLLSMYRTGFGMSSFCLGMIDEPFAKMSQENVSKMVTFLKDLGLQMIYFSASNDAINDLADKTITVVKTSSGRTVHEERNEKECNAA